MPKSSFEIFPSSARLASARSVAASSSCSTQSLINLRDASAVGRGMSPRLPVRPLPWLGPVEASQAHCPADPCFAQMCREHFRSAHSCAFWRLCRACVLPSRSLAHHPGLRCCLHSPARARGAPWFSSQATVELRPSRWLQRCSVPAFWFLHVLHAPDAVLHGPPWRLSWRLPNSDSSVCAHGCRGRAGYLSCGLAPFAPCNMTYVEDRQPSCQGEPARRLQGLRLAL